MGTLLRPDPDKHDAPDKKRAADSDNTPDGKPFEFIERPRKAPDIYVSRPELGPHPDSGKSRGDGRK